MGVNRLPKTVTRQRRESRLRFEPGPFCARVQHANKSAIEPCTLLLDKTTGTLLHTRCYFNARSKANTSQLNLPHGINI